MAGGRSEAGKEELLEELWQRRGDLEIWDLDHDSFYT